MLKLLRSMSNRCRQGGALWLTALFGVALLTGCEQAAQPQAGEETPPAQTAEAAPPEPAAKPCALTVGWDPWEPYSYETLNGELAGLDIELMRVIADRAACTVRFKQGKWRDLLAALRVGQVDVLMAATPLPERREFAWFSKPYRSELFVQLVRSEDAEGMADKSVAQMLEAGKTIGLTDGYFYGETVHDLLADDANRDQFLMAAVPELNFRRLVDGQVDVVVGDPFVAIAILRRTGNSTAVKRLDGDVLSGPVSLMLSRSSVSEDDVDRLDAALEAAKVAGDIDAILARYSGDAS